MPASVAISGAVLSFAAACSSGAAMAIPYESMGYRTGLNVGIGMLVLLAVLALTMIGLSSTLVSRIPPEARRLRAEADASVAFSVLALVALLYVAWKFRRGAMSYEGLIAIVIASIIAGSTLSAIAAFADEIIASEE